VADAKKSAARFAGVEALVLGRLPAARLADLKALLRLTVEYQEAATACGLAWDTLVDVESRISNARYRGVPEYRSAADAYDAALRRREVASAALLLHANPRTEPGDE
jgi:hypothetical protein